MKNKATMTVLLLIGMISNQRKTSCSNKMVPALDVMQFRAPYGLTELLHDGLVDLEEKIEEIINSVNVADDALSLSAQMIEGLSEQYLSMIDRSIIHDVRKDDRDYLQSMIDRIDQMIQSLEGTKSFSGDQHGALQQNLELLSDLRNKLSN